MIQISEEEKEHLSEMCGKMLHYGGKMMQCLESIGDEDEDDETVNMRHGLRRIHRIGMRRSGMREDLRHDEFPEDYERTGMRRGGRRNRYDGEW